MSDFAKVGELYTSLSEALEMLRLRRQDAPLCARVASYFERLPADRVMSGGAAVYAPALVTPNLEMNYLRDVTAELPLKTVYLEFSHDKFVQLNYSKRSLAHLHFFKTNDDGSRVEMGDKLILDIQSAQGKPMDEITTLQNENFVSFHHRLLRHAYGSTSPEIHDFSQWFTESMHFDPEFPYARYLGLFLTDGILFANFTTEKREEAFTQNRVLPAFRKLREEFGIVPLIVPIQPTESDNESYWCYYPNTLLPYC